MAGAGSWIVPTGVPPNWEFTRPAAGARGFAAGGPWRDSPKAYPLAAASATAAAVLLVLFLSCLLSRHVSLLRAQIRFSIAHTPGASQGHCQ